MLNKALLRAARLVRPPVCSSLPGRCWASASRCMLPAVVGVVLAAVFWFVPDLMLRRDAGTARAECAHAIAVYLELVALRPRPGSRSRAPSSKPRMWAAAGCSCASRMPSMRARVGAHRPVGGPLSDLGERLDVPVLADVADFVQMSTQEGASVYDTVRHRAASLRTEQLNTEAAAANANTEKMQALAVLCVPRHGGPGLSCPPERLSTRAPERRTPMSDLFLKTGMLLARIPAAISRRVEEAHEEITERGDRGDNPVVTVILWVAGIGIAVTIVAALVALGNRASSKVDNVDLGG
ncbi:hypothetical protein [Streptomyces sp. KL116D]|uniref:hypothetical protein n=2 Tax=Streptomyces sp. KL116D TaxID=3045152 RepID=UPI003558D7BB